MSNELERILNLAGVHKEAPVVESGKECSCCGNSIDEQGKCGCDESCEHCGGQHALSEETSGTIKVNKDIPLAGDSIWFDNDIDSVHVTEITVGDPDDEEGDYRHISVGHDGPWEIYTDSGFAEEISKIVGFEVDWTEQGMQDTGIASLEGYVDTANEGNEFTHELKKAKDAGEDEFEVDGKKYKVKESEEVNEDDRVEDTFQNIMKGYRGIQPDDKDVGNYIGKGMSKEQILKLIDMLHDKGYDKDFLMKDLAPMMEAEIEEISEAPTMDTTQLIHLLKLSGISEEKINEHIEKLSEEWANTPEGVGETEPTQHGDEDNYNFAQMVNLSLKRYLDAQDMKVSVNEGHTAEGMRAKYDAMKNK